MLYLFEQFFDKTEIVYKLWINFFFGYGLQPVVFRLSLPLGTQPGSYNRKEEWFAKRTSLQSRPSPGDGDPGYCPTIQRKEVNFCLLL